MGSETMGRVLTEVLIENLSDLYQVKAGSLRPEEVRRINITDALVDTGATSLSIPSSLIHSTARFESSFQEACPQRRRDSRSQCVRRSSADDSGARLHDRRRGSSRRRSRPDRADTARIHGFRRRSWQPAPDREPGPRRRAHPRAVLSPGERGGVSPLKREIQRQGGDWRTGTVAVNRQPPNHPTRRGVKSGCCGRSELWFILQGADAAPLARIR